MPVSKPHQCPTCGKAVDVALLAYSDTARDFVCPACRSAGATASLSQPLPQRASPPWPWIIALICVVIVCATTVTMVLVSRSPSSPAVATDDRRAWEDANRDKIIALKSDAETLVIAGKLAEGHAKYRQLQSLVGGRTIADARLFDLVEQARTDQTRVYMMIMHSMSPQVVLPNNGLPAAVTQSATATSSPSPSGRGQGEGDWFARTPVATRPHPNPLPEGEGEGVQLAPSAAVGATTTTSPAARTMPTTWPIQPPIANVPLVTDAQVEAALLRGADFLISQFDMGELRRFQGEGEVDHHGLDALAVYALLQASKSVTHPKLGIKGEFLPACIDRLRAFDMNAMGNVQAPLTYAHSLRASALATYNRPEDRAVLQADVKWLIRAAVDGAYTYDDRFSGPRPQSRRMPSRRERSAAVAQALQRSSNRARVILIDEGGIEGGPPMPPSFIPPIRPNPVYGKPERRYLPTPKQKYMSGFPWDNSNSQYGVLGVWAGAEVGIEVPQKYWKQVRQHWTDCQLPSGQWSYVPSVDASFSMTCGGIASLLVAHDYLEAPLLGTRLAPVKPYDEATTAGLAFLEDGDNSVDILQTARDTLLLAGYNLFGLERVGLASGLKYFGVHDWFAELAARVMPAQWPNGAWGRDDRGQQAVIDTAYIMLFLARGRHPIMMNKLRFEGPWTNRPRDLANLTAFAGREMERPVNWQTVDITRPPDDWADSPILYLASNRALELDANNLQKLKEFMDQGGLLFTHSDLSSGSFNTWIAGLAKSLYPDYPMSDLPTEHPIYSLNYKISNPRPRLQGVSNGSRLLWVHSPSDLSIAWQTRAVVSKKETFQLAINLYAYTTGKERFRNRLDTRCVPYPFAGPAPTFDVAQLQYDGNWNPEPGAWRRFAKKFQNETGVRLDVRTAKSSELSPADTNYLLVLLTGTGPKVPSDADLAGAAKYVTDGGTLLVDACGGSGEFANNIEAWLAKLAPAAKFEPLPPDDDLFKATIDMTADVPAKTLRLYAMEQLRNDTPRIKQALIGKGRVIYSALDIRSGLLGTNTWGVLGYLPEYSEALMKNLALGTIKRGANLRR